MYRSVAAARRTSCEYRSRRVAPIVASAFVAVRRIGGAIATATEESSARWLVARFLCHEPNRRLPPHAGDRVGGPDHACARRADDRVRFGTRSFASGHHHSVGVRGRLGPRLERSHGGDISVPLCRQPRRLDWAAASGQRQAEAEVNRPDPDHDACADISGSCVAKCSSRRRRAPTPPPWPEASAVGRVPRLLGAEGKRLKRGATQGPVTCRALDGFEVPVSVSARR